LFENVKEPNLKNFDDGELVELHIFFTVYGVICKTLSKLKKKE